MHKQLSHIIIAFFCWWIILLPFDYSIIDPIVKLIQAPFYGLLKLADSSLIFESDTYGMYTLFAFALFLGIISEKLVAYIINKRKIESRLALQVVLSGILIFFLMKYGWDKVVKKQFYLPEPNTLYSPLGNLSKDIAFWSVTGSSYTYNLFLGLSEILVAILLLFRRTRFLGSILSILTFTQIVIINISFDISVKGLALSLLIASLLLSITYEEKWKMLLGFQLCTTNNLKTKSISRILKWSLFSLILLECCLPSFMSRNFNDDSANRPIHHGAYTIIGNNEFKRIFIHRRNYIIFQTQSDEFIDFKATPDQKGNWSVLNEPESVQIHLIWNNDKGQLTINQKSYKLIQLPYQRMPLLNNNVHVFSDTFH